jgi:class 3 adenylate cyclase/tetratricopeptide (TPR) repeat protein
METCERCGAELPPEARFCPSCGAPTGRGAETLKLATVLFADVVGSTARASGMHPEEIRDLMSEYFAAMSEEIAAEGGVVEKYIGDAVMAVFGAPRAHEDDPLRAVRAARRMLARLQRLNEGRSEPIQIRIGIDTGQVIASEGTGRDLLVTGDSVNVAARLQQASEPGQVLVGERTALAVRGHFDLRALPPLDLRGKADPVAAWAVEGPRGQSEARGIPGLTAPMVGRDDELLLLQTLFDRVRRGGRPQLATVMGDAGVGKSRLATEFSRVAERDARIGVGRCLPYGEGVTMWPLAEILKGEAGIVDNDPPHVARERIEKLASDEIEATDPEGLPRVVDALLTTLGTASGSLRDADPKFVYRELVEAWRALLGGMSRSRPVVLVIEDIHWADDTMLEVVDDLAERVEGAVMFVCTARPDLLRTRSDWGGGRRNFSFVALDPLSPDDGLALVSALLDVEELPVELRDRILDRAEGNPFFLEEIVRRLIDEGHLVRSAGRWSARGSIAEIVIPDTVQSVILARLDLLSPDERRVAQRAAVVGRIFWSGAVAELVGPNVDLDAVLRTLRRRELVVERSSSSMAGEIEYAFKHVLIRDVAYNSLPRRERGPAHARVAGWIETKSGERAPELAELLAHHYSVSWELTNDESSRRKARDHYRKAAENALRRFALRQAESYGKRFVELSSGAAEQIDALEVAGDFYAATGQGDRAWRSYKEALSILEQSESDDPWLFARIAGKATIIPTRWLGSLRDDPPDLREIEELIERGLSAAGAEDSRERGLLLSSRAFLRGMGYVEPDDEGRRAAEEAVSIAERLDDPDLLSTALDAYGGLLLPEARYGDMIAIDSRRIALVSSLGRSVEIGDAYCMMAWSECFVGRYHAAYEHSTAAIEHSRGINPGTYLHGLSWRVQARFMTGDWDGTMEDLAEIDRMTAEGGRDLPVPYTTNAHGVALFCSVLRGDEDRADELLRLLERFYEEIPGLGQRSKAFVARAVLHRGDPQRARELLELGVTFTRPLHLEALCEIAWHLGPEECEEALRLVRSEEGKGLEPLTLFAARLEGRMAAAAAEHDRAEELLRRSVEGFTALGAPWEAAWSSLLLAVAIAANGRDASALATGAAATFRRLGSLRELERAEALLSQ